MADVTCEQLTAALERLGYHVDVDKIGRDYCPTSPHYDFAFVSHRSPEGALEAALRELVPLGVLVRGVMGETTPTTGEIANGHG